MTQPKLDLLSQSIETYLVPALKLRQFTSFQGRCGWRYLEDRIEVVQVTAPFNQRVIPLENLKTLSAQIHLGIYFLAIPPLHRPNFKAVHHPRPAITNCHFRKTIAIDLYAGDEERLAQWFTHGRREKIEHLVKNGRAAILESGLPWFNKYRATDRVLDMLRSSGAGQDENDAWGMGAPNSPTRYLYIGFLAKSIGEPEIARQAFEKVLSFNLYLFLHSRIRRELNDL